MDFVFILKFCVLTWQASVTLLKHYPCMLIVSFRIPISEALSTFTYLDSALLSTFLLFCIQVCL